MYVLIVFLTARPVPTANVPYYAPFMKIDAQSMPDSSYLVSSAELTLLSSCLISSFPYAYILEVLVVSIILIIIWS